MNSLRSISSERVARLAHPSWAVERWIIVLEAYLDASGTRPEQGVVAIAGFAATEAQWRRFEDRWESFLASSDINLSRWHTTDLYGRRGEYERWDGTRDLIAVSEIGRILTEVQPFGAGAAVWRSDWEDLRVELPALNLEPDPLGFCLDYCLSALIHRLHEVPRDEGIAIYVDRDENENLAREITDWHVAYYRANGEMDDPDRNINLMFGSNRQYLPLQAADILANEAFRHMHGKTGIPILGAVPMDGSDPKLSPLVKAMLPGCRLMVPCFNKELLRIELEARASGDVRPDGRNPLAFRRR
jgi:hypothetical protein